MMVNETDLNKQGGFWATLGLVRFILASLVMFSHIGIVTDPSFYGKYIFNPYLPGFGAVLGFFIVSGYSIAASSLERPEGFLKRRILRIYPNYILGLMISLSPFAINGWTSFITSAGVSRISPSVDMVLGNFFLLQGFLVLTIPTFGQAWSLSIEVCYYILVKFLNKLKLRSTIFIFIISLAVFVLALPKVKVVQDSLYGITALGLYWAWISGYVLYRSKNAALNVSLLVLSMLGLNRFDPGPKSWLIFLTVWLVLYFARAGLVMKPWLRNALNFLGDISWPLYITHFGVMCLLNMLGVDDPTKLFLSCGVVAILSHFLVEGLTVWIRARGSALYARA